jgi:hypothetical protein
MIPDERQTPECQDLELQSNPRTAEIRQYYRRLIAQLSHPRKWIELSPSEEIASQRFPLLYRESSNQSQLEHMIWQEEINSYFASLPSLGIQQLAWEQNRVVGATLYPKPLSEKGSRLHALWWLDRLGLDFLRELAVPDSFAVGAVLGLFPDLVHLELAEIRSHQVSVWQSLEQPIPDSGSFKPASTRLRSLKLKTAFLDRLNWKGILGVSGLDHLPSLEIETQSLRAFRHLPSLFLHPMWQQLTELRLTIQQLGSRSYQWDTFEWPPLLKSVEVDSGGQAFSRVLERKLRQYPTLFSEARRISLPNSMDHPSLKSMATHGRCLRLEEFCCSENNLRDEAIVAWAERGNFPALRSLDLSNNQLTDRGLEALLFTPIFQQFQSLSLRQNRLTKRGIQAFLASPYLENLVDVDVSENGYLSSDDKREILTGVISKKLNRIHILYETKRSKQHSIKAIAT